MRLAPALASDPAASRGRCHPETSVTRGGPRDAFQRDRDRIIHSIAFRRLRHKTQVFIAPAWREIYVQDTERTQDFDEACRTEAAMREAYPRYGYTLIDLPRASVAERTAFIRRECGV